MALIIKEIKLEVSKPNLIQAIVAKQNDCNSRFLKVSLWDEGTQLSINPSAEVTINAERNDGKSDSFFGEVNEDNTATVPLHSWMLELEGTVNCDVSIIVDGRRLTTTTFVVKVEKAACGSDDIIDNPQYDVLTNLINEVNAQGDIAKNTFASAIKWTASGNPIRLDDVSPLEHEMAVGVKSRNILPIVPYDGSKTVSGITFTLNDDNSLHIKGTATAGTNFAYVSENVGQRKPIKKGTYTISGANGLISGSNIGRIVLGVTGVNEYYAYENTPKIVTIAEDTTMYFKVSIFQGATVDTTIYPMLELGDTASSYSKPVDVGEKLIAGGEFCLTDITEEGVCTISGFEEFYNELDGNVYCKISFTNGKYYSVSVFDVHCDDAAEFITKEGLKDGDVLLIKLGEHEDEEVFDLYSVTTVQKLGKNIWKFEDMKHTGTGAPIKEKTETGFVVWGGQNSAMYTRYTWLPISVLDGAECTISFTATPSGNNKGGIVVRYTSEDLNTKIVIVDKSLIAGDFSSTFKVDSTKAQNCKYLEFVFYGNRGVTDGLTATDTVEYSNFQIEIGKATAYEPYHSETFTADENGKVNGIIGNGEDITLMGDGVTITAEYNADTKKYIDKKFAELAAMIVSG